MTRATSGPAEALLPAGNDAFEDSDTPGFGKALASSLGRSATHPAEVTAAALAFALSMGKVGPAAIGRIFPGASKVVDTAVPSDRRFADAAWNDNAAFFALRQAYDSACHLGEDVLAAGAGDPVVDAKALLAWRLLADALSPTNFLVSNPAALRRAVETGGWSLVKGATNFLNDVVTNGGKPRQVDGSSFEVGRNLAATPGTVVFRNDLIELIQYAPRTESVHAVPLLAIPPWINKYYVMDLAPGRSFLEWAVEHERTVFVISYRNADDTMRGTSMDEYLARGPCAALDVVTDITGSATIDLVGLCIGGAMTAMTAAYLAQSEPERIGTVTLLNTLLDYSEPGPLGAFTDAASVARLEQQMARSGFLDGEKMAGTFDMLRPNQLIFNYVVSNWLLGESPPAFDILVWNADSTRIPATLHAFYLRSLYVDNLLARGELRLAGADPPARTTSPVTPTLSGPSTTTSCRGPRPTRPPSFSAATSATCCPAADTSPASSTHPAGNPGSKRRTRTRRPPRTGGSARSGRPGRGGPTGAPGPPCVPDPSLRHRRSRPTIPHSATRPAPTCSADRPNRSP